MIAIIGGGQKRAPYVPYEGGLQPPATTDLILWFDADDISTMYSDIARTRTPSFNAHNIIDVRSISDKSGSLNHATVGTENEKMWFTPFRNRAYLDIPVKANFVNPVVLSGLSSATRVCVLSSTSQNRKHPLWSVRGDRNGHGVFYPYGNDVYDNFGVGGRPRMFNVGLFALKTSSATSAPWLDVVRVDTNTTYYLDDLNVAAYSSTADPAIYSSTYNLGGGTLNWRAAMFEMLIYNRVLSDAELRDIVAYVNDKWAVGAIGPIEIQYTLDASDGSTILTSGDALASEGQAVLKWNTWVSGTSSPVYRDGDNAIDWSGTTALLGVPAANNTRNLVDETVIVIFERIDEKYKVLLCFGQFGQANVQVVMVQLMGGGSIRLDIQSYDKSIWNNWTIMPASAHIDNGRVMLSFAYNSATETVRTRYKTTTESKTLSDVTAQTYTAGTVHVNDATQTDLLLGYGTSLSQVSSYSMNNCRIHELQIHDSILTDTAWNAACDALDTKWFS